RELLRCRRAVGRGGTAPAGCRAAVAWLYRKRRAVAPREGGAPVALPVPHARPDRLRHVEPVAAGGAFHARSRAVGAGALAGVLRGEAPPRRLLYGGGVELHPAPARS